MKAQKIFENIEFERGRDPKDAMQIGHWGIKRALLDQPPVTADSDMGDAMRNWWENGGIPEEFKEEMDYNDSDPLAFTDFVGFDDDYYLETEAPDWVDYDDFHSDFMPTARRKNKPNTNGWGRFDWQFGELPDGTKVIKYMDGMNSGYLTKKEWLK